MILKYNINIDNQIIVKRIQNLVNQTYKLLPIREEGDDWEKPLETVLQELIGIKRLLGSKYSEVFFPLLSKMEGLYSLNEDKYFQCYRRTIFECLGLMNILQKQICQQNY